MKKIFLAFILCAFASSAFAYGPYFTYPEKEGGQPYRLKDGKITWKNDNGPLSKKVPLKKKSSGCDEKADPCGSAMTSCGVLNCITKKFEEWSNATLVTRGSDVSTKAVKVANLNIKYGGNIGEEDINGDNFFTDYYPKFEKSGTVQNPIGYIVFDEDGEIMRGIQGEGAKTLYIGITILFKDSKSPYYKSAVMIFNGKAFDDIEDSDIKEMSSAKEFGNTIMHEEGHLLGLDHTQPLREIMGDNEKAAPDKPIGVPTMYPLNITLDQYDLHDDDKSGLAFLYWQDGTTQEFKDSFCVIEGEVKNAKDGISYQGVNVVAYANVDAENEKYADQRSFVSGALYPPHTPKGDYKLTGIIPGIPYKVVLEAIMPSFSDSFSGSINPFGIDEENPMKSPTEEDFTKGNNAIVSSQGKENVACNQLAEAYSAQKDATEVVKGTVISMPPSDAPAPSVTADTEDTEDDGGGSEKKGWCMSVAGGFSPVWGILLPALLGLKLFIRRRLKS